MVLVVLPIMTSDLNSWHDFLYDFDSIDAIFQADAESQSIDQDLGLGARKIPQDFRNHLDEKFVISCKNENPLFDKSKIQSVDILNQVDARYICENCYKSRRYFCYHCFTVSPSLVDKLPNVRLPIKIDIIKHPKELDGKSTSPHAAVLSPQDVRMFVYPEIPEDWPEDKVFLIFPKKGSPTVGQYLERLPSKPSLFLDALPIQRVVFIDSTWRQTKSILQDDRLNKLPTLVIDSEETIFWRYHKRRPVHFLSTIEAIYYFLVQMHNSISRLSYQNELEDCWAKSSIVIPKSSGNADPDSGGTDCDRHCSMALLSQPYQGQYDNLLFFFKHTYYLIKNRYHL